MMSHHTSIWLASFEDFFGEAHRQAPTVEHFERRLAAARVLHNVRTTMAARNPSGIGTCSHGQALKNVRCRDPQ